MPLAYLGNSNVPENSVANASAVARFIAAAGKELVLDTALPMKLVHVI